jgi:two-component system sensor histidine kinase DesK
VRVRAGLADAAVEVVDDGEGPACLRGETVEHTGHGITGLTERAERLRGRIEAGGLPDGHGFRLAVSIPVSGAPA